LTGKVIRLEVKLRAAQDMWMLRDNKQINTSLFDC
jgi:hypothetical protein